MAGQTARPRFETRLPAKGCVEEPWGAPAMVAKSAARCRQDAATARRTAPAFFKRECGITTKRRVDRRAVSLVFLRE